MRLCWKNRLQAKPFSLAPPDDTLFRSRKMAGRPWHGTTQSDRLLDPRCNGILNRCERGFGGFAIRHAPREVGYERDEAAPLVLG